MSPVVFYALDGILSLIIAIILAYRRHKTKDKSSFYWSIGFFAYAFSDFIASVLSLGVFVFDPFTIIAIYFIRQTLVSFLFLSVYFGVVKLLTKNKVLIFWMPLIFFVLQIMLLLYSDFGLALSKDISENLSLTDTIHVLFYDVPFNFLVGLLFLRFYMAGRKKYALFISVGWFGYVLTTLFSFYAEGSSLMEYSSLIPMVFMLLGFVYYYESPTGQFLLELEPVQENAAIGKLKYKISKGESYLISEDKPKKSFDVFSNAINNGILGLCITRFAQDAVKVCLGIKKTPYVWLSRQQNEKAVDPQNLEQVHYAIENFMQSSFEIVNKGEPKQSEEQIKNNTEDVKTLEAKDTKHEDEDLALAEATLKSMAKKPKVKREENILENKEDEITPVLEVKKPKITKKNISSSLEIIGGEDVSEETSKSARQKKEVKSTDSSVKKSTVPNKSSSLEIIGLKPLSGTKTENIAKLKTDTKSSIITKKPTAKKSSALELIGSKQGIDLGETNKKEVKAVKEETKKSKKKTSAFEIIGGGKEAKMVFNPKDAKIKSIVLLDGISYLVSNNEFSKVLHFLESVVDKATQYDSVVIIPLNKESFTEKEYSLLISGLRQANL